MEAATKLFATLWSLRDYPTRENTWGWQQKYQEIRDAGFDGFMSPFSGEVAPPVSFLHDRDGLDYLAITSLSAKDQILPAVQDALQFSPVALIVQLCDHDTPLSQSLELMVALVEECHRFGLPVSIETHRDTCTETPEKTWALAEAYRVHTGSLPPLCFDFSHFAVVKHMAPPYWNRFKRWHDLIQAASYFHLRPFNGHHCQIPATVDGRQRSPEYLAWLEFAEIFFDFRCRAEGLPAWIVVEMGNTMYNLSGFPDVWNDARLVLHDLKALREGTN